MMPHPSSLDDAAASVERTGSQGEKQLARMLQHYRIPFSYEHPVAVVDRGKVRVWYCDFLVPDYGVILEYAGRMDDAHYRAGMAHKQAVYEASGMPCVVVEPEWLQGYWPARILNEIRGRMAGRLDAFDAICHRAGYDQE